MYLQGFLDNSFPTLKSKLLLELTEKWNTSFIKKLKFWSFHFKELERALFLPFNSNIQDGLKLFHYWKYDFIFIYPTLRF